MELIIITNKGNDESSSTNIIQDHNDTNSGMNSNMHGWLYTCTL